MPASLVHPTRAEGNARERAGSLGQPGTRLTRRGGLPEERADEVVDAPRTPRYRKPMTWPARSYDAVAAAGRRTTRAAGRGGGRGGRAERDAGGPDHRTRGRENRAERAPTPRQTDEKMRGRTDKERRADVPIPERSTSPRVTSRTVRVDSLKALDPKRPIREADIGRRYGFDGSVAFDPGCVKTRRLN